MSFQAYIDNVEAKTGKSAEALKAIAIDKGLADEAGLEFVAESELDLTSALHRRFPAKIALRASSEIGSAST